MVIESIGVAQSNRMSIIYRNNLDELITLDHPALLRYCIMLSCPISLNDPVISSYFLAFNNSMFQNCLIICEYILYYCSGQRRANENVLRCEDAGVSVCYRLYESNN